MIMNKTLNIVLDADGVAVVRFDHVRRPTNTFTIEALNELSVAIDRLETGDLRDAGGVVFTSAKAEGFIAGADLFEINTMDGTQLHAFLRLGQSLFDRIAHLAMPTVAAINGHCLGGGLELALACDRRVATDRGVVRIGLPEIKLGIIPAWGGTTRLTHMLGPIRALPILLTGTTMAPRRAQRAGIVDEVVRHEALIAAAKRNMKKAGEATSPGLMARLSRTAAPARRVVLNAARRRSLAKTCGNYPAAEALIDVVEMACREGHAVGLRGERDAVLRLSETDACRNLMRLFHLRHAAKQQVRAATGAESRGTPASSAVVVGGGTMGSGIAHALIVAGVRVRLLEINDKVLSGALQRIDKLLRDDVRAKRLSSLEAQEAMHHVSPCILPSADTGSDRGMDLTMADVVIEAVSERPEIKQPLFTRLDRWMRSDAVLASNTSSLSIGDLAAVTRHPDRVIGMHFFNPVNKMPLIEIVRTDASGSDALSLGVEIAMRMGKTPVLVSDAPGFLVNRLLIPYLAEAFVMASEGVSIAHVDDVMKRWGMPMGPFELLDQIGLDVAAVITESLRGALGDHIVVPDAVAAVMEKGWFGRKTGRGFYCYRRNKVYVHQAMVNLFAAGSRRPDPGRTQIEDRLLMPMINETVRVLEEGIVTSADTIDLATVLGLGLAPFRGGLLRHAETLGAAEIVERMLRLSDDIGPRFSPVRSLRQLAADDGHAAIATLAVEHDRPGSGAGRVDPESESRVA